MTERFFLTAILIFSLGIKPFLQTNLEVEGDAVIRDADAAKLDILNTSNNTKSFIRFGDNNTLKSSIGFSGLNDAFTISMSDDLDLPDFTVFGDGKIGINSAPTAHRLFIKHNSTSGVSGSAHLTLEETGSSDYARLRFGNQGQDDLWVIAARATDGSSLMNFFYNDGSNFANIMSLDGDLFRVGIHETSPEAFLHIKQNTAGVDALKFENDDQTGGEIWGWRIGDNDILLYFEGALRGSFNSDDGVYTNFPPPVPPVNKMHTKVLPNLLNLRPVQYSKSYDSEISIVLDPMQVNEVNSDWVTRSEDKKHLGLNYNQFTVLNIKAIQEQQEVILQQAERIKSLEFKNELLERRLQALEDKIK